MMMEVPEQQTEVPAALKQLARLVVRGFYGPEHALAMDALIRSPCLREEDLLELLKFGPKQLHSVLNTLKGDKFVRCHTQVETSSSSAAADGGGGGKKTRHNYYFINSRMLVNVIKYKLDKMRRRLEAEEQESVNRASFRCPCCDSTFTDLDAGRLFDAAKGTFHCTCCQTEVEDNVSAAASPKRDARNLVVRFNEQIAPIYLQLREAENNGKCGAAAASAAGASSSLGAASGRGGAALFRGGPAAAKGGSLSSYADLYTQNVVISMGGEQDRGRAGKASEAEAPKEQPVWLTQSTVQGAYCEPDAVAPDVAAAPGGGALDGSGGGAAARGGGGAKSHESEIIRLLFHEKRSDANGGGGGGGEDEEEEDDDEFEEVGEEYVVMVGGRALSYQEVSQKPELVGQMSAQEKEAYITMGQRIYEATHDE